MAKFVIVEVEKDANKDWRKIIAERIKNSLRSAGIDIFFTSKINIESKKQYGRSITQIYFKRHLLYNDSIYFGSNSEVNIVLDIADSDARESQTHDVLIVTNKNYKELFTYAIPLGINFKEHIGVFSPVEVTEDPVMGIELYHKLPFDPLMLIESNSVLGWLSLTRHIFTYWNTKQVCNKPFVSIMPESSIYSKNHPIAELVYYLTTNVIDWSKVSKEEYKRLEGFFSNLLHEYTCVLYSFSPSPEEAVFRYFVHLYKGKLKSENVDIDQLVYDVTRGLYAEILNMDRILLVAKYLYTVFIKDASALKAKS